MTTATLELNVTRAFIREAEKGNARKCAIAQAIVDCDPDIVWANVTTKFIRYAYGDTDLIYQFRTPTVAANFIRDFDMGMAVKPFTLRLGSEEFYSQYRRRVNQRDTAANVALRRAVAKLTNRSVKDITIEEAKKRLPTFVKAVAKDPEAATVSGKLVTTATPRRKTAGGSVDTEEISVAEILATMDKGSRVKKPRNPNPKKYNIRTHDAGILK